MLVTNTSVRILGVDPGFDRLGIAILDKDGPSEKLIYSTCITTSKEEDFGTRLFELGKELEKIIKEYSPSELAIETIFIHSNQKTVIRVAEVRGVCLYFAKAEGLAIFEYSPLQVKLAITGYGRSTKDDIAIMLPRILKMDVSKKSLDDELDAVAIALTHSAQRKMEGWRKSL